MIISNCVKILQNCIKVSFTLNIFISFTTLVKCNVCFFMVSFQMTKLAIIPCTVLLETLFFSKQFRLTFFNLSFSYHFLFKIYFSEISCPFGQFYPHDSYLRWLITFYSKKIRFSLTVLLMGVGIATVTDLQLNMLGSVLSLLAVLTTCVA